MFRSLSFDPLEDRRLLSAAAIIAENSLPGASPDEWDIVGSGSANIQGFAAQFSVNHGERVDFKIDTDASDYRIDIYRTGYYDGLGAREVATINPQASLANNQPEALVDYETGLVDAGNMRVSASWNVPQTAVSGVYVAKLVREDGVFGESHIIFVVRDDEGHSDLLLQTSDTTWQAYNTYGGSSLYDNYFLPLGRAYEVSYNRPFNTRGIKPDSFYFGAEYPMVRFLEANGYDISYTSGIDTDRRGAELLEHKVFVSVGHDEYWSGQQRANVEAARDAGVNLAFFSGNEMFWKTRWEDSTDASSTPYRTLVTYKETHDNAKTDPLPGVWTGTWRDPRFSPPADGGRPENAVTGTLFTVNGDGSIGTSITVGATEGKMRFWRNTSVANLTGSQTATLGDYVLGYEWDEDIDNGFRPAGLFHLSTTTVNVSSYIQDYGSTYAPGTATHHMTLYRASSGALVFGAGTIQYSWGLDSYHDGPATSDDPVMQQATINLFADMGVQPGQLMENLVAAVMSTDFTAPVSTITSPTEGMILQSGVAVTIRGTAQEQGGGRVAGVEVSVDGGATWHLATGLQNWTYTWTPRSAGMATIMSRAIDDSGNLEVPTHGVTINPSQNPGVYSLWDASATPAIVDSGDAQGTELGLRFRVDSDGYITGLRFYKASANSGTHVARLWSNTGTLLATVTFTGETGSGWQQVNFATPVPVTAGATYVASYTAPNGHYSVSRSYFTSTGVDNGPLHAVAQGPSGSNGIYSYTTGAFPTLSYQESNYWVDVILNTSMASDQTAPTVTKFGQAGGGAVVTTTSAFTITFSEALNAATVNTNTITMVKPDNTMVPTGCCPTPGGWCSGCPLLNAVNNTPVTATVSYDASAKTATITPTSALNPATVYTIIVSAGGVKDLAGNALAVDTWSSVYTSNQSAPVQSSFWNSSTAPSVLDSNDPNAVELGLKFTADTDGAISAARFYKSSANTGTHVASLWTSSGQKLATATFTGETNSGWQQVSFATPVAITAGTTYVISYHTNSGHYSVTRPYFSSQFNSGPLHAPANGGVYTYGANSVFPTQSFQSSNYFVDVVFSTTPTGDTVAPTITNFNPFNGTPNVPVNPTLTINFSEALDTSTVSATTIKLLDGGNNAVPATLVYDAATRTATLTPTSALANAMTYTIFTLGGSAGIRDLAGNPMAQNTTSSFSTVAGAVQDNTPPTITAFNPLNGAVSVNTSAVLTVTFSESLNAATVKPTTVYLLRGGVTLVPTTLTYNATTKTATLTPSSPLLNSTSYTIYVLGGVTGVKDLADNAMTQNVASVFTTAAASDTAPPTVTVLSPASGSSSVATSTTPTVTFSEALTASTVTTGTVLLMDGSTTVATSVSYNATNRTATLTPNSALANSKTYTIVVKGGASGIKDLAGNALVSDVTSVFTTVAASDAIPPTVTAFSPAGGSSSVATNTTPTVTFSEALTASTVNTGSVLLMDGSTTVAASVSYNATNRTAILTPNSSLANSKTYTIVVKGGASGIKDLAGNALVSDVTSSFTTVVQVTPSTDIQSTLWSSTTTPAKVDSGDNLAVELGTKFTSDSNGFVDGVRFYKSAANTGTHSASLWNAGGQLLATATFTSETSSGWQQVNFATPVAVTAGTTYVMSYHTNAGHYSVNSSYFGTQFNSGLLHVPANGGVYRYGASAFPSQSFQANNYWVDVVLRTTPSVDTTPPAVAAFSPASGAANVAINSTPTVRFSEPVVAGTVTTSTVFLRGPNNVVVPTTVSYNSATNTATLTPTSALSNSTTYTIVVKGGSAGIKDMAGNTMASDSTSSFTTAAVASAPVSLWNNSATPAIIDSGDPQSVELGTRFTADSNGTITGARFYKSAANTGTHTASLWTASGQLLATATFTGETASGWQQVNFASPVAITAGTTYVISYHTNVGRYSVTRNYFGSTFTSGALHVPANGGVYRYGASAFPSQSFQASNYWVDVVFVPSN